MFEPQEPITKKYIEDMISEQIHYFQKKLTSEIKAIKDAIFIDMRDELFHIMKLKEEFISEKVRAEIDKFDLKCVELNEKLYDDMRKGDNNNIDMLNKLRKDVFYKE